MKQKRLWILSGAPGAGKSTWVNKKIKKNGGICVSRDEIRFSIIKDDEEYFSHENEVFNEFVKQIQKALNQGGDVYADATHLNWGSRNKLLSRLNLKNTFVGILVFKIPLNICLSRNSLREGRKIVPEDSIKRMYKYASHPSHDPFLYNEIRNIYLDGEEYVIDSNE